MVVNDLDLERIAVLPAETNSPLIIDADAVLSGSITTELLEPIPGRHAQIRKCFRGINRDELTQHRAQQVGRVATHRLAAEERLGVSVAEALDHTGR